jgi:hypothetical protein
MVIGGGAGGGGFRRGKDVEVAERGAAPAWVTGEVLAAFSAGLSKNWSTTSGFSHVKYPPDAIAMSIAAIASNARGEPISRNRGVGVAAEGASPPVSWSAVEWPWRSGLATAISA